MDYHVFSDASVCNSRFCGYCYAITHAPVNHTKDKYANSNLAILFKMIEEKAKYTTEALPGVCRSIDGEVFAHARGLTACPQTDGLVVLWTDLNNLHQLLRHEKASRGDNLKTALAELKQAMKRHANVVILKVDCRNPIYRQCHLKAYQVAHPQKHPTKHLRSRHEEELKKKNWP